MRHDFRNHLPQVVGYLFYALVAFGVLAWLLFPAAKVRQAAVGLLNGIGPGIQWRIGEVAWRLPLILSFTGVEGFVPSDSTAPVLKVDRVELSPGWKNLVHAQKLWVHYSLLLGKGRVEGRLSKSGSSGYQIQGTVRGLQLAAFPLLAHGLERKVQGELHAVFEMERIVNGSPGWRWKAQVTVDRGQVTLARPIFRHTVLPFSQVSVLLLGENGRVVVDQGKIHSTLGQGWLNGTIHLDSYWPRSQLALRGGFHPEPSFFQGFDSTVTLLSIRDQLKNKPLPVSISGTVHHPGIHFEDLTMQISALEQEGR